MDKIIEKLKKIKELADRGERGEALAAKRKLEQGLLRHGLTLEDLDSTVRTQRIFKYHYGQESQIIFQIVMKVLNTSKISYSTWKGKNKLGLNYRILNILRFKPWWIFTSNNFVKSSKPKSKK